MSNQEFISSKPSESTAELPSKGLTKEYYVYLLGRNAGNRHAHYAYDALGLTIW